tara:strand:- start:829 stop:1296 length:468 start_codon:yes stop_codon:yes gene_type:complete
MSKIEVNEIAVRTGTNITFNNTVEIDAIKGKTTAGSISVTGEGNSTTTNLQQGLSKAWFFVEGDISTPATRDSFNAGSVTDHATGDYAVALTNPFSTVDNIFVSDAGYTQLVGGPYVCSSYYWGYSDQRRMRIGLTNGTLTDCEQVNGSLFGDLA